MFLDYFALGLIFFVAITLFYGVIVIHDIPYEIAHKRNHPHQDAIHVAGWVSLFTLHVIWPFLWIWATLYREDRGWGFQTTQGKQSEGEGGEASGPDGPDAESDRLAQEVEALREQIGVLTKRLAALESGEAKE